MISDVTNLQDLGTVTPPFFTWSVYLGAISAASLPLGALLGLLFPPTCRAIGALSAFGAGALLAALAVELVAPAVAALHADEPHAQPALLALIAGSVLGGIAFLALDALVASKGGFLRNVSGTLAWLSARTARHDRELLESLCMVDLFRACPPELLAPLIHDVQIVDLRAGDALFHEDDVAHDLFVVRSGMVDLRHGNHEVTTASRHDFVGETALVLGSRRLFDARARTQSSLFRIRSSAVDALRSASPEFDAAVRGLADEKLEAWSQERLGDFERERRWARAASDALQTRSRVPSPQELKSIADATPGAPIAIWLGMMLDGIPESLVIGGGLVASATALMADGATPSFGALVPVTLIAGLFLANLPEALSASATMASQGMSKLRVFAMWSSLLAMTALGAGVGSILSSHIDHVTLVGMEGLASGAMLAMLSTSAIPEAVHLGGRALTGVSVLFGFLAPIALALW